MSQAAAWGVLLLFLALFGQDVTLFERLVSMLGGF